MDTQKPSSPLVSSQNQARITPDLMQLRHSLGFGLSGTSSNPFSSRENLVDSGNVFTQHAPGSKSMEEASEGILGLQTEARNAARIISQSALRQEMENRTQAPWNNTAVSSIPMALYPTEGQVSVPILLDSHQEQAERYQFPVYNPLDDSALASAPSQFPVYNPLDDSVLASVHSQFPVYNPLDDSVLASAPSQFPVYNPLDDSVLASVHSQFPVYNPLDDSATALAPQYPVHDALFAKSSQPSSLIHPKNPVQGSMPPKPQNHDPDGVHYDYMINHMFPVTFQI
ncbi:uncharacterized protein LDX57_007868 [Aspergillus melleus]|uniref:uncharacterized protein n=1 Tax=Aspergillus melleus TaxID=138277 RepID=UPI001E8D2FAF|nr:uncharacterized protein LDX57_007868 [Aspergillus melleus]KAH8430199.1 hypothetical protein LDX57_007868 [Aspergillus melleus]